MKPQLWISSLGAVAITLALLIFLTRLSGSVDLPQYDPEGVLVTVITPPEQQQVEPPKPPPPKPPKPKESPRFEPTPMVSSARPIPGIELSPGPGIGVSIPDLNTDGLVFSQADLDNDPRAIVNAVDYPYRARRLQIEGIVRVRFRVLDDGSVTDIEILSAEPKDIFENAVLEAVPRWRFEPGRVGGKAVEWIMTTTIDFTLKP